LALIVSQAFGSEKQPEKMKPTESFDELADIVRSMGGIVGG
jgi:hypothetical protein